MVFVAPDEFAKLGAPIADVIVPDHLGAAKGEQAANCFTDHHAPDVTDMKLLRGVRGTEIDHIFLTVVQRGGA